MTKKTMKKMKFITMTLMGLSLLGFGSCWDDDDDDYSYNSLTSDEQYTCYTQVQGYYSGDVMYYSDISTYTIDTVACSFNITRTVQDTAMVYKMCIYNLPIKALACYMSDGDFKTAMEEAEDITLECTIEFYSMSPVTWLVNPVTPEFTLEYGGATHKIQVPFLVNNYYSYGAYGTVSTSSSTSIKQIQMNIMAASIYVDGAQTSLLSSYAQFFIVANVD